MSMKKIFWSLVVLVLLFELYVFVYLHTPYELSACPAYPDGHTSAHCNDDGCKCEAPDGTITKAPRRWMW